jgi:hypothetical protein
MADEGAEALGEGAEGVVAALETVNEDEEERLLHSACHRGGEAVMSMLSRLTGVKDDRLPGPERE